MDKEELKCSICFKKYDTKDLLPRIIPICGHTLCSECISSALEKLEPDQPFLCPFDNKKFNLKTKQLALFPKNFTLAKVIEKEENEKHQVQKPASVVVESIYPLCTKHNKPKDLACIEDRDITCSDCGLFGEHKNHDLRKIDDIQKLVQKKAKLVEDMIKAILEEEEVYQKMITQMINTKKREIEETIEIKFTEYIKELNKKKQELLQQSVVVFDRLFNYYATERLPENEESVQGVKKAKDEARNNYDAFKNMNPAKPDDICFDMVAFKIEDTEREVKAHLAVIKNNYQAHVTEKLKPLSLVFDENFLSGMEIVCQLQTEVDEFKKVVVKPIPIKQPVLIPTIENVNEEPPTFHSPRENGNAKQSFQVKEEKKAPSSLTYLNVEEAKAMEIPKVKATMKESTPKMEPNYPSEESLKSLKQYGLLIEISEDDKVVIKGSRKQHHMITDETATKLYMILRRMTKCAALTLNLGGCGYQITSQGLTIIAAAFPALPELKYLEINFRNGGIGDGGVSDLSNSITKMNSLKKLKMFFTDCQKLSDRALTEIGLSIAKSTLTDLELNFALCAKVTDKGLAGLSTSLSKISKVPGLNKLVLNFEGCDKITDNGIMKLVSLFPDMPWAETIDLNFKHCSKVTNSSLHSLCQYMEKSKNTSGMTKFFNLKSLSLSFGSCDKIDNKGLMMVAEQISKFSSLESCSIDFSYCDSLTDLGLTELSKSLIKLKQTLKTIRLNFQGCEKVTETGVVDVSLFISNLNSLSNLKLVFSDCKKLGDDVIGVLSIKLCNLNSLKHLHLSFSRCNEITNDSIIGLSHALKNLWTIEDLALFFDYCTDIGNTGLQALSESLSSLTSTITQLKINFSHCERVGDPGIIRLSETLSQLIYLRDLELFFVSCALISGESLIKLGESIEKLSKLDIIQIYFHGCGHIDESAKNKLQAIGSKVPQNYIFI